jgi:hypothetical protein
MNKLEPLKNYSREWFLEQINNGQGGLTTLARKLNVSTSAIHKKFIKFGIQSMEKSIGWPLIRELKKLKNRPIESGLDDRYIIDSKIGSKSLNKIIGTNQSFSTTVTRALVNKFCRPGDQVLEPYAQSGHALLGTLSVDCSYTGVTHNPNTYANLQKIVELLGTTKADINYEKSKPEKFKFIISYLPEPPLLIKKRCKMAVTELFKIGTEMLADGGHVAICMPEWVKIPETPGLREIESLWIKSTYDEVGTRAKKIRIWKYMKNND